LIPLADNLASGLTGRHLPLRTDAFFPLAQSDFTGAPHAERTLSSPREGDAACSLKRRSDPAKTLILLALPRELQAGSNINWLGGAVAIS
jgi:hypothetical protein